MSSFERRKQSHLRNSPHTPVRAHTLASAGRTRTIASAMLGDIWQKHRSGAGPMRRNERNDSAESARGPALPSPAGPLRPLRPRRVRHRGPASRSISTRLDKSIFRPPPLLRPLSIAPPPRPFTLPSSHSDFHDHDRDQSCSLKVASPVGRQMPPQKCVCLRSPH